MVPETAVGGEVDGKPGVIRGNRILDAGRGRVGLVVIEMNIVARDIGQIIRREIELRQCDVLSLRLRRCEIAIERPVVDVVA
jgi:hypothetical protein